MKEVLRDIPGFNGKYLVSNLGNIYSNHSKKKLKPLLNKGYEFVCIGRKMRPIHRLVLLCFVGPSELDCDHIDCNPRNNNISNLQYVTRQENNRLSFERKTAAIGSRKNQSILKEKDVTIIRKMRKNGKSLIEIATRFNSCISTISLITNRKTWKHV